MAAPRARTVLRHLGVAALAALFVGLGVWQLGRWQERRRENALLVRRSRLPVLPLEEVDPRAAAGRRVVVSGTFDPAREVVLTSRAFGGRPGHHLLTPLVTPGRLAVIVDRGWVPFEWDRPPVQQALPPASEVRVEGVLLPSERGSRFGFGEPRGGTVSRVDVAALRRSLPYPRVYPLWLQLTSQDPPQLGGAPVPQPPPAPGEGPHLSYAVQWFAFAAILVVGYGALLRRGGLRGAPPPSPAPG